jgi:RNA polymerase sigma-70 factor (ECF subfamily)
VTDAVAAGRPAILAGFDVEPLDASRAYRLLAPAVLGYLRAHAAPEPEDLLGEVFVQVARDIGRFRGGEEDLRRWVLTIARNRLIDDRRRRRVRPVSSGDEVPEVGWEPLDGAGFDRELVEALQSLTPDQREVVVLRFVADLSLADVARITGRRAGAVKALQHRALAALSDRLG